MMPRVRADNALARQEKLMSFSTRNIDNLGDTVHVTFPKDKDGFIGRECPVKKCEGYFKIKPGTGLTGSDLKCHCPYCGHTGKPDSFHTKQQLKYAESVAERMVLEALNQDLKSWEFEKQISGPIGIRMSMKFTPGALPPVRHYRDPELETKVICDGCTLAYSIYGVFAYCPDCRAHNSLHILNRNLELTERQLALASTLPDQDLTRHLLEDSLENCVSAFDGFGRETCRVRAAASTDPQGCTAVSFQNLERVQKKLYRLFGFDLTNTLSGQDWASATRSFLKRHVISHRAGVVDQQYVDESGDTSATVGRRIQLTADEVRQLIANLQQMATGLLKGLPPPQA
ncbi:MAG TPA: hypothetical protein VHO25_15365 [Polyangiaceae bacterium]|nr:hypothetical protein [Polyangiaceae bacterium]